VAEARSEIEQARDAQRPPISQVGNKAASQETAMIKAVAFNMVQTIVDWAIQAFGGGDISNDHFLAATLAATRLLQLADGPDEVHRN
jgi:acyl-CoA dehydrogenase